ncbi:exopolysaccharide biosynthesis protein [Legionella israelensis]|uniref:Proton transporter n=1 Tax=Legionella israelensis TaxID=454 RepID=A0A0W0WG74_9GAMM|nr:exopolysaccharide biosynthesis protein [Legionella israelensis]KTD31339.1 proton transporter [Legionella israelensis]SCY14830.1 Exopolysaccharide synthesis, ExoD [Legionella israelensis DSM 19235]STX59247.1 ABC transporter permease [Legionella israelensis]
MSCFALLLIIFSLGLIEKDGGFIMLGYVATTIYVSFVSLFIMTAIQHIMAWIDMAL